MSRLVRGSDDTSDYRKNSCLSEVMERVLLFTKKLRRNDAIARPSAGALVHFWQEKSGYVERRSSSHVGRTIMGAGFLACDQE